jgi:hypothetical protein
MQSREFAIRWVREAERNAPRGKAFQDGVFRCRCTHPTQRFDLIIVDQASASRIVATAAITRQNEPKHLR